MGESAANPKRHFDYSHGPNALGRSWQLEIGLVIDPVELVMYIFMISKRRSIPQS